MRNYSGLIAIAVYLCLLVLFMKLKGMKKVKPAAEIKEETYAPLDENDEDALVAALVAAIDCRNETKKNVRIVSVREVK